MKLETKLLLALTAVSCVPLAVAIFFAKIPALVAVGLLGCAFVVVLVAWLVSWLLWLKPHRAKRWLWGVAGAVILTGAVTLAWTQLPELKDRVDKMLVVEGMESNDRWDLWAGTLRLWQRNPLLGSGLGSYRHVIGPDKPPTQDKVLEQAHNDWLEWMATTGIVGTIVLLAGAGSIFWSLRPRYLRRLRFEMRYPLAGAAFALIATALHETIGFGLQVPLNRYLLAVWIGLLWGLNAKIRARHRVGTVAEKRRVASEDRAAGVGGDSKHDEQ